MFINPVSDKVLTLRLHNELLQLSNKRTTQLTNGQKIWIEGSSPVVNKHLKRCSASLVIRTTQHKTVRKYLHGHQMGRNRQDGQDQEGWRCRNRSLRAAGTAVGSHFGKQLGGFFKRKIYHTATPRCILKRMKNLSPHGDSDANVHSSINS